MPTVNYNARPDAAVTGARDSIQTQVKVWARDTVRDATHQPVQPPQRRPPPAKRLRVAGRPHATTSDLTKTAGAHCADSGPRRLHLCRQVGTPACTMAREAQRQRDRR